MGFSLTEPFIEVTSSPATGDIILAVAIVAAVALALVLVLGRLRGKKK